MVQGAWVRGFPGWLQRIIWGKQKACLLQAQELTWHCRTTKTDLWPVSLGLLHTPWAQTLYDAKLEHEAIPPTFQFFSFVHKVVMKGVSQQWVATKCGTRSVQPLVKIAIWHITFQGTKMGRLPSIICWIAASGNQGVSHVDEITTYLPIWLKSMRGLLLWKEHCEIYRGLIPPCHGFDVRTLILMTISSSNSHHHITSSSPFCAKY